MNSLSLITFDVGGTLLSPHPTVGEAYAEELSSLGLRCDAARMQTRFGVALRQWTQGNGYGGNARDDRETWRAIVRETVALEAIPPERFDEAFDHLFNAFATGARWRLHEGARELLAHLDKTGYRLAILSNSDSRTRRVLEDHDLMDFFEAVFLSGEIGYEKPDRRLFDHVVDTIGVPPDQILHVGDSPRHDLEGARHAGWQGFLLSSHGHSLQDLFRALE
ncbi:MAG: HAD-IA family hydrolase [Opitutales bacterium]